MSGRCFRMGRYNDIWVRTQAYEKAEKEKKKETREKIRAKQNSELSNEEDNLGLAEDERVLGMWETLDHKIIKKYVPPLFNPEPLPEKDPKAKGAVTKYKKRYAQYLAFIDSVKYIRSREYCTVLALATTSKMLQNIFGEPKSVSNALGALEKIGLIKEYTHTWQTGYCKLYCYFWENEERLKEYCQQNNIQKLELKNQQTLNPRQRAAYQARCEDIYPTKFKNRVLFKSQMRLTRPTKVKPKQFISDLYEMLYENYPGFKLYQQMAEEINSTYYVDQPEFHIRFDPTFHWNGESKGDKYKKKKPDDKKPKPQTSIVGIGIRATNKLCSAKKGNDVVDQKTKQLLRQEVLDKYGFKFEKDITSSVPRVAYALNHGGWLKEDVDLYERIYREVDPEGSEEDFKLEREAIKKLFFRVYFDNSDGNLVWHTWDHMVQEGMDRDAVSRDMINLRRAMEAVLGEQRYDNYIFYVESCIYIDTLHTLLEKGYKVWLVYDCFYGTGFGTQEEFENLVKEAVWISFVRFKMASDFNDWENIFGIKVGE